MHTDKENVDVLFTLSSIILEEELVSYPQNEHRFRYIPLPYPILHLHSLPVSEHVKWHRSIISCLSPLEMMINCGTVLLRPDIGEK